MAPPTRSPSLSWANVVPVVALVVLGATWGRTPARSSSSWWRSSWRGPCSPRCTTPRWSPTGSVSRSARWCSAVAVTIIEVALIVTLMVSGGPETATLARDTVFAAVMITCNGIVGLSLLLGARRYGLAVFNAEGSGAALATVATLATLSLVLPTFTTSRPGPEFSGSQLAFAARRLAGAVRGVRADPDRPAPRLLPPRRHGRRRSTRRRSTPSRRRAGRRSISLVLLLVALVAVVGLAKVESPAIEAGVAAVGFPPSFVGVVIALLVLLPETLAASRAALRNRVQISLNLAFGSAMASIGLTIPAIAVASIWLEGPLLLGLGATQMVLLALTVVVAALTVVPGRATRLQGAVHLVLLAAFLFLAVNP